jgi:hypothetical protein
MLSAVQSACSPTEFVKIGPHNAPICTQQGLFFSVPYGSVWDHILDFWKLRHEPNVMFTTYEAMKKVTAHTSQSTYLLM